MLAALQFYAFLFVLFIVAPATLIGVVLLFVDHERQLLQHAIPVDDSGDQARAPPSGSEAVRPRFPRIGAFVARRSRLDDPWGLPATIAVLATLLGIAALRGAVRNIAAADPLAILDVRLHNAFSLFHTDQMTWWMLVLTELGGATVLALVCIGSSLLALARGHLRLAATFMLALTGTGLLSIVLKTVFGHAHVPGANGSAAAADFPSGHLLSATVVYGFIAVLLLGSTARRSVRAVGTTVLLLVIVGIGLSRLYLGVHWPSDLMQSLALALVVLPTLLFFLHYSGPIPLVDRPHITMSARGLRTAGSCVLLITLLAPPVLASYRNRDTIEERPALCPLELRALQAALPMDLPRQSEDLVGGKMEPVSIVFVASQPGLIAGFSRAGWSRADLPTPVRVLEEGLAGLRNRSDPTGPATPAFFADHPQDLTFEKPDAGTPNIRHRHHTRVWRTPYCVAPSCRPVWVATASYDVGVEFSRRLHLPTHRIDPAVDNERALIVADLLSIGAKLGGSIAVLPALHGTNAAGDAFFTDGRAVIVLLP